MEFVLKMLLFFSSICFAACLCGGEIFVTQRWTEVDRNGCHKFFAELAFVDQVFCTGRLVESEGKYRNLLKKTTGLQPCEPPHFVCGDLLIS